MTDYLFLTGRIRVLESKLLNINRLDRMLVAKTPDDAFRVLVELQYCEYFDEKTKAKDFSVMIETGLYETKKMLTAEGEKAIPFQFLWRRFDINNLKRAFKLRFIDKVDIPFEFTEENGFSNLGILTSEKIQKLIWQDNEETRVTLYFSEAVIEAKKIWNKNNDIKEVERLFDKYLFESLFILNSKLKNQFLHEVLEFWIDSTNFRTLARKIIILKDQLSNEDWLSGGNYSFSNIKNINNFTKFLNWAKHSKFSTITKNISENNPTEAIWQIEKRIDRKYYDFLEDWTQGEIGSLQIPFAYFEKRLQNARFIRFIMSAKFRGMSEDFIRKELIHF